jgi:hypothetical protein
MPAAVLIVLSVIIIGLVLFGGWVAFAFAFALMIAGVFGLTRYVQRVSWTRRPRKHSGRSLSEMSRDLAVTDDARRDVSPHDLPKGSPERLEAERRIHEAEA